MRSYGSTHFHPWQFLLLLCSNFLIFGFWVPPQVGFWILLLWPLEPLKVLLLSDMIGYSKLTLDNSCSKPGHILFSKELLYIIIDLNQSAHYGVSHYCLAFSEDRFSLLTFLFRGERKRRGSGRGRENLKQAPCPAESLTQGSILQPWDGDLSRNQELDT